MIRRKKRKKRDAFLQNRWTVERNMANIAVNFFSVKGAERRSIKRKSKKMNRKKIVDQEDE